MTVKQRVAARLLPVLWSWADPLVRQVLADRRQAYLVARNETAALSQALRALETDLRTVSPRFDRTPLGPSLGIHAAHARDPRVQALFAARGLPDCPGCPVGADETLGEAAFAEGFSLDELLGALGDLGV